ncbi:hypothetical protein [Bacillus sp. NPDC094106]|uniref:hypothetical protein n=1 Tax=Bacillus sp. NPDC094106 TaxID=3363949 RepID=UPI00382961C6
MFTLEQLQKLRKESQGNVVIEGLIADIELFHKKLEYAHRFAKRDELYDANYVDETLSGFDGVLFDAEKMKKLVKKDALIRFEVERLGTNDKALEIVFNSFILGDLNMERFYKNL